MTYSSLISRAITTPNQSSRGGRAIDHIILHHMASTNGRAVEQMMSSGSKEVSANYIQRNDGELVGVVPEEKRSWSVSNAEWDGRSITVETENHSTEGWTISAAAHEKLAQLVADVAKRYNLPINRSVVIGHREVYTIHHAGYSTACPGGLDLDWIVARALQIAASAAGNTPTPILTEGSLMKLILHRRGNDMAYYVISPTQIIGPIVMGDERLAGVLAAYGPAVVVMNDGLEGIRDVVTTNVAMNVAAGI